VTHDQGEALAVSDRIIVMANAVAPQYQGMFESACCAGREHTVPIDVVLPGKELIDRKFIESAYLFDWYLAPADGLDNSRLASRRPPLSQWRQLRHMPRKPLLDWGHPLTPRAPPSTR
jgi:hypothetical protein